GVQKVVGDSQREAIAPPPELKAQGQVGANDVLLDADSKLRRGFIYLTNPQDKEIIFSFAMQLALRYLDAEGISPQQVDGKDIWQLGKSRFVPFAANDGGYVRANDRGYQLLLNYRGSSRYFETVPLRDVLHNRLPKDWGRDRIILIGAVGESFQDLYLTPYSSNLFALPERMTGVEVHANITSEIISAAKEGRPLIKSWAEPLEWVWILLWTTVGAVLSWQGRYSSSISKFSWSKALGFVVAGGVVVGSTYIAFLGGWWIPVIPPLLGLTGSAIAITAYIARTAGEIRQTFGRYLNEQVVANLLENPEGLKLGGERRKITILTSDLRGFTATSEQLAPEEVIKILNLYFAHMADAIVSFQGTIDEFMGDGILVLFGAPTARDDDAERAVACAVAMQLAMESVNNKMKQLGLPGLEMGIGINTGEVVVGNIGSEKRTKYGVVGSQVNLTYRIESYTVGGQILITESTLKDAGSQVIINGQKQVQPKGLKEPITIYAVGGIQGNYNLLLPQDEELYLPLAEAIPLEYRVLDDKHISETHFQGSLVKLSAKGAEVYSENLVMALTNIKLNFVDSNRTIPTSGDIYAKVLDKSTNNGSFYIHFTFLPVDIETELRKIYHHLSQRDDVNSG
ncbi:MAG TPA: adenylate/guanylate cyclase domain-containing protein, partial [Cyanophyceae cyanobacterium]